MERMPGRGELTKDDFDDLYAQVREWDHATPRGTLRYLTPDRVAAAGGLVRSGITVGLSLPISTERRPDNPTPAQHRMTDLGGDDSIALQFVKDFIGTDFHNDGHTHLDALCHVSYDGQFFGGVPDTSATDAGAAIGDVTAAADGIVGRGVLLDIPRVRGVAWLEPGDQVTVDDVLAAEQAQAVRVEAGDILLVRTGHTRRLAELGPWDTSKAKAGLDPTVVPLLAERRISVLGCDTNSDAAPSHVEDVDFPIHVLAINAMGMYLVDYLQLDELAVRCEHQRRWEFLCTIAPLHVPGGTGSPINPIAVL
jgi:kynurenine formamidase